MILSVAYSHDKLHVISGSADKTLRIWDAENGKLSRTDAHNDAVTSVCFSPDDMWITSGSLDKTIHVRNASNGALFFKEFVSSQVTSVAFFPSFSREYIKLALASTDGIARIWCVSIDSDERTWGGSLNDGWLIKNDGNLVIWFPPSIRRTLVSYPCARILNSRSSTALTMPIYQGNQWTKYFPLSV